MPEYLVSWEMTVEASSPEEAAKEAREILLDPQNIASVFVIDGVEIDALEVSNEN